MIIPAKLFSNSYTIKPVLNQNKYTNLKQTDSDKVSFKGHNTDDVVITNKMGRILVINETYFFRNLETLKFVVDYISKVFNKGTNIADFGCSSGEETYSLAIMLKNKNKDKKYKITGYDLSPKAINKAKSEISSVMYYAYEGFLRHDEELNSINKPYRQPFLECFDKIPEELTDEYIESKKQKGALEKLDSYGRQVGYMLKEGIFDGIVDFKTGDICDITKLREHENNTGVVIFKNAWYHLTGARSIEPIEDANLSIVKDVVADTAKILPKNGLLVVGQLHWDHLYDIDKKGKYQTRQIMQDGKMIEVCDSTAFHDLLRENGFKPIFYEQIKNIDGDSKPDDVYLPSVWQKIK